MLMAHTDVVPAPDADWTVPPFAAEIRDARVLGRGAADMKGELAARAAAFAELARSGAVPPGDVVLVAEADEERNTSDVGMSWLVREREDLRCDFALNEGGGTLLELKDGRRVVTISLGERSSPPSGSGFSVERATRRSRPAPTTFCDGLPLPWRRCSITRRPRS